MSRWLRWYQAKRRLTSPSSWSVPGAVSIRVSHEKHAVRPDDFSPNAKAYEKLATVWDTYGGCCVPRYWLFLASVETHFGYSIKSVLDLACGTGILTRRLAGSAERVVGLDASEAMLEKAHSRTVAKHVRYVRADFRDFSLGESFDAAVCASDSLNYLERPAELANVFLSVRRHLRPGGFLAFDVLDDAGFLWSARRKTVASVGSKRFELYYFYNANLRVSESRAVMEGAVERHRRIPLEDRDVRRATAGTGLELLEHFTWRKYFVVRERVARQFYLLRRAS